MSGNATMDGPDSSSTANYTVIYRNLQDDLQTKMCMMWFADEIKPYNRRDNLCCTYASARPMKSY